MNIPEEIKKKIENLASLDGISLSDERRLIEFGEKCYSLSQSAIADKDKEIERLKREKSIGMELCVEFGYIQSEKGNNIQAALINYQALNPKMI